ncbi:MAG: hypothetical protein CMG00_05135 [Candidatus Marinimicrobia bacterium]|nr:hypothetical protein [Candidatus Neomarinimicrobiota bacterium]
MDVSNSHFWEDRYFSNNIPWDTKTTTPALINSVNHLKSKKIAILGCGYSKDSLFLAKKGHKVYPIDFASKPIEYLNDLKNKEALDNLFPVQEDIFNLSREYSNFFDIVLEYTCFCAIDTKMRPQYVELVKDVLNKNGKFIALFFPTERIEGDIDKGPPFYVNFEETLSMFKNNFNIIKIDKSPNSIKPRKGFEILVTMDKK